MTSLQRSFIFFGFLCVAPLCGALAQALPSDLAPTSGAAAPTSPSSASSAAFPGPRRQRHAQAAQASRVARAARAGADKAPSDLAEASPQCKAKTIVVYEPIEDIEKEQNDEMMAILAKDDAKEAAKESSKGPSPLKTP